MNTYARESQEYKLIRRIGAISEVHDGWTKQANIIAWNGYPAKMDIRPWDAEGVTYGKGITLDENEVDTLISDFLSFIDTHPAPLATNRQYCRMPDYTIKEQVSALSSRRNGYRKELNIVSWNGGRPEFDLRSWKKDYKAPGKGIRFNVAEMKNLIKTLLWYRDGEKTPTLEKSIALESEHLEALQESGYRYTYLAGEPIEVIARLNKKTGETSARVETYAGSENLMEYLSEDLEDAILIMAMDEVKKPVPKTKSVPAPTESVKKPGKKNGGPTIKPVTYGHTVTQEMLDAKTLVERVEAACKAANISRNTLSREADVSPATFWLWKKGNNSSDETLRRISSFLGVRMKWLKSGATPVLDGRLHGIFENELAAEDAGIIAETQKHAEDRIDKALEKHVDSNLLVTYGQAKKMMSREDMQIEKGADDLSVVNSCINRLASLTPEKAKNYYRVLQEIRASLEGAVIFGDSYSANLIPQTEMLSLLNDIIGDIKTLGLEDDETKKAYRIFAGRRSEIELEILG